MINKMNKITKENLLRKHCAGFTESNKSFLNKIRKVNLTIKDFKNKKDLSLIQNQMFPHPLIFIIIPLVKSFAKKVLTVN